MITHRNQIKDFLALLPDPDEEILKGVKWGSCDQLFTPAYWKLQYHFHKDIFNKEFYSFSDDIVEEISACLLGGYGMPSELGFAAFDRLRNLDLLQKDCTYSELLTALSVPFWIDGKLRHYRFAKQKARFLHQFLNRDDIDSIPTSDDCKLRDWLLTVKGIGMKTASWITRNWLGSENVAILDIHIYRAGLIAGVFDQNLSIDKHYKELETQYLEFTKAMEVSAANLDSLIWLQLKQVNGLAIKILNQSA